MDLDYFEIEIDGRIHPVAKHELSPYEKSLGKSGYGITVWDSTIEAAKLVVSKYDIQYLKISTSDLNFIKEPVFENINGVRINGEIKDLTPLEHLKRLEYLELFNERKGEVDLKNFQTLKLFSCAFSNNYKNINSLKNLEFLHLVKYPKTDFEELSGFHKLKELDLFSSKCESLRGLESLKNLEKITIHNCKKLTSLIGLKNNKSLTELIIIGCKNLSDFSSVENLSMKCVVLVDGNRIKDGNLLISTENKIENLITSLNTISTEKRIIKEVKTELENLKANITELNWKDELKKCICNLNKLNEYIYTEEREEIISTIEYLLIDFDSDEIEEIIDGNRTW